MEELEHLEVDIADVEDIRAKLPRARTLLAAKRERADNAQSEYLAFRALFDRLAVIAGEREETDSPPARGGRRKPSPVQDAAVRVVMKQGDPIRPRQVARILETEGLSIASTNAINSALYSAYKAGRLSRPKPGTYAPPDFETPPNGSADGANGDLPSPGARADQMGLHG